MQKELEAYKKAEEQRKLNEMSEIERAKAEAQELAEKVKQYEINETKRNVITELGLDAKYLPFIQGNDEETIKASAEALKAALPQPADESQKEIKQTAKVPGINPSNPAGGAKPSETEAERRKRLVG